MGTQVLDEKTTKKILDNISEILQELELQGAAAILNCNGIFLDDNLSGIEEPRLMKKNIAYLGALETLCSIEEIKDAEKYIELLKQRLKNIGMDPEHYLQSTGGCLIVNEGDLLGSVGLIEQTTNAFQKILKTAIEGAGFSTNLPENRNILKNVDFPGRVDISEEEIKDALSRYKNKL